MAASHTLSQMLGLQGSIYGQKLYLRQHDLMVRERAAEAVLEGVAAIRTLAVAYRAERIPASTREHPYPPAEAMTALRHIEDLAGRLSAAADAIRNLALPAEDYVWERLRSGSLQLELLAEADLRLITYGEALRDRARSLTLDTASVPTAIAAVDTADAELRSAVEGRRAMLAAG